MPELRGVGIGLGVAQGPVARMAEPLPAPSDAPSEISADEETARVHEAVAAVARELEPRGAQAGGAAQDVLEAQAMMAEDPSLESTRSTTASPQGKTAEFAVHDAFASFRDAAHRHGRLPRRARRRPRRRRPARHRAPARCSGTRCSRPGSPVRAGREGPRPCRHRAARPRQGARARHHRGRTDLAHRDPRPREVDRRGRRRRRREGARRRRDGDRGCREGRRDDEADGRRARAGAEPRRRPRVRRHPPRSPTALSPTAPRCRCWRTSASPAVPPRRSSSAPRAWGCSAPSSSS